MYGRPSVVLESANQRRALRFYRCVCLAVGATRRQRLQLNDDTSWSSDILAGPAQSTRGRTATCYKRSLPPTTPRLRVHSSGTTPGFIRWRPVGAARGPRTLSAHPPVTIISQSLRQRGALSGYQSMDTDDLTREGQTWTCTKGKRTFPPWTLSPRTFPPPRDLVLCNYRRL